MISNRNIARFVGTLFLTVNVTFILGAAVFIEPILGAPNYLTLVTANRAQVDIGVLLELINGIAYVGIAALMYPILKRRFESLALGYVGFRLVEFVMQLACDFSPLMLMTVSQDFVKAGATESSLQTLGAVLLTERQSAFLMVSLTFGVGALLFYFMLYRLRLIPRIISIWGLIGATFVLISFAVDVFGFSLEATISTILGLPMLLNELFLGVWLLVRGFSSSTVVSELSQAELNKVQEA